MATLNTLICRCTGELSCERTFLVWEPVQILTLSGYFCSELHFNLKSHSLKSFLICYSSLSDTISDFYQLGLVLWIVLLRAISFLNLYSPHLTDQRPFYKNFIRIFRISRTDSLIRKVWKSAFIQDLDTDLSWTYHDLVETMICALKKEYRE